jgi:hypothetical protein
MLPCLRVSWYGGIDKCGAYHAQWEEVARFDVIERDVTRHLTDCVSLSTVSRKLHVFVSAETYPTVKTVLIWLSWLPLKSNSSFMPET